MRLEDQAIVAIIPAYNEEKSITAVVRSTLAHLPVLVVDDGSADRTAKRAREGGGEVVSLKKNLGKGGALKAGFRHAMNRGYSAVVTLDGDGQHDPEGIPGFLGTWRSSSADLIIGARSFCKMPILRRLSNTLGRWIFSLAMGRMIRDNQSGYRLISRRLMEAMLASSEEGFEFEMEMILTCLGKNMKLKWVPIRTIYQGEASHIKNIPHVRNFLRMAWEARRRLRRMKEVE